MRYIAEVKCHKIRLNLAQQLENKHHFKVIHKSMTNDQHEVFCRKYVQDLAIKS